MSPRKNEGIHEVVTPASAAAPIFTWTGFYAGGSFGNVSMRDRATHYDIGSGCWWNCTTDVNIGGNGAGVLGGVQAGYNWQIGTFVGGLEADLSATSVSAGYQQYCQSSGYCDYSQRARMSALSTIRGRIGYAFDRAFIYATGGLAFANVKNHVQDNNDPGLFNVSKWRTGWTLGAGVEYAMSDVWSVKVEGLYYSLENSKAFFRDPGKGGLYAARFKNNGVIARVGLNYRFGGPASGMTRGY